MSNGKYVIVKGDKTSHGGTVLEGISSHPILNQPIACKGHLVSCPLCKGNYPIIEGVDNYLVDNKNPAVEGMKTACGATLIASQNVFLIGYTPPKNRVIPELFMKNWIGFQLPKNRDYSGLKYKITLSNGKILNGILDESNYTKKHVDLDCNSALIEFENLDIKEEKQSITEIFLNKIKG